MMGFSFSNRKYYLVSTAFTCSTIVESTQVESTQVESTATAVESDFTSVDGPEPQDANATIDNNNTIFFIIFFLYFFISINIRKNFKHIKFMLNLLFN